MEKTDFLDTVAAALARNGMNDATIISYTNRMSEIIDKMSDAEREDLLKDSGNVDKYIDSLVASAKKGEKKAEKAPIAKPEEKKAPPVKPEEKKVSAAKPEEKREPTVRPEEKKAQQKPAPIQNKPRDPMAEKRAAVANKPDAPRAPEGIRKPDRTPAKSMASAKDRNDTRFWILFAAILPLLIIAFAAGAVIFAALTLALVAIIVISALSVVAIAAVGTAAALVGIIYGGLTMSSSMPIALYEIGQGLVFGGAAIFIGVALYNIAVRLNPYVIRKLAALFALLIRKTNELFRSLKAKLNA